MAGVTAGEIPLPAIRSTSVDDQWWQADTAEARINVYLRCIYSTAFCDRIREGWGRLPEATRSLIGSFRHLEDEQQARVANVRAALTRSCPLVWGVLDDAAIDAALSVWVDSDEFWEGVGRTLPESFCLIVYRLSRDEHPFEAEVARLQGVCNALMAMSSPTSPWPSHVVSMRPGGLSESFTSGYRLVDENGLLARDRVSGPNHAFSIVVRARLGAVQVESTEVWRKP